MPLWGSIALIVGAILLLAAAITIAYFAWRAYERRVLLRLLSRQQAVEAAESALHDAVERLAGAPDEELESFADDPEISERRVLAEVRSRAAMLVEELDRMPLPRSFVPLAEAIADAAHVICDQAGVVRDEDVGPEALERLGSVDLALVRAYSRKAHALLYGTCEECGLDETAVYGGGLYL